MHVCLLSPSFPQHLHRLTSCERDRAMGSAVRVLMLLLVNNPEITIEVIYLPGVHILNCFVLADHPKFAPPRNSAGTPSSYAVNERLRESSSKSRRPGPFHHLLLLPGALLSYGANPSHPSPPGTASPRRCYEHKQPKKTRPELALELPGGSRTARLVRAHGAVRSGPLRSLPRCGHTAGPAASPGPGPRPAHPPGRAGGQHSSARAHSSARGRMAAPSFPHSLRPSEGPSVRPSVRAGDPQQAGAVQEPHRDPLLPQGGGCAPGRGGAGGRGGKREREGRGGEGAGAAGAAPRDAGPRGSPRARLGHGKRWRARPG